jgi:3-oxoacyl-[acyl-carrier protein] reductase
VREFVTSSTDHLYIAEPEDVAKVIAFLCSDDARMITGNILRMR